MEGRESMGLMMPNIMTADFMLRTVSILTQRGRNLMSIGTAIRIRAENCSDFSHIFHNDGRTVHKFYGII